MVLHPFLQTRCRQHTSPHRLHTSRCLACSHYALHTSCCAACSSAVLHISCSLACSPNECIAYLPLSCMLSSCNTHLPLCCMPARVSAQAELSRVCPRPLPWCAQSGQVSKGWGRSRCAECVHHQGSRKKMLQCTRVCGPVCVGSTSVQPTVCAADSACSLKYMVTVESVRAAHRTPKKV